MSIEIFLPEGDWKKDTGSLHKTLLSTSGIIGVPAGVMGFRALSAVAGVFFAARFVPGVGIPFIIAQPILVLLIRALLARQLDKKVNAILEVFGHEYTRSQILKLRKSNRQEFNRLYRLASNEFFRRYIEEQADHKKTQEIIATLQSLIDQMREKQDGLMTLKKQNERIINELKEEIEVYEGILIDWQKETRDG